MVESVFSSDLAILNRVEEMGISFRLSVQFSHSLVSDSVTP